MNLQNTVSITKYEENFNLEISFKNLTWDNLNRLNFALKEYIKIEEERLNGWSEKEKKEWNVVERQHPVIEMGKLMKDEILKINPLHEHYL